MSKGARQAEHQYLMRLARSKLPPLQPVGGPVSIGQREDRACPCCGYHVCKNFNTSAAAVTHRALAGASLLKPAMNLYDYAPPSPFMIPVAVDATMRPGWQRVRDEYTHESGHCVVTKNLSTAHSFIDMQGTRAPRQWMGQPHGSLEAAFARCESYLDNLQAANEVRAGIRPRVRSR